MRNKLSSKISQTLGYLGFLSLTFSCMTSPVEAKNETIIAQSSRKTITCESEKGRRKRCLFNAPNGVELINTLSSGSCEGKWSYDDRRQYIEVWDGCRARFEERYYNSNNNSNSRTIICGSVDGRTHRCKFDAVDRVELVRVLSNGSCEGNWGYDRRSGHIEVRNGCRGQFKGISYSNPNDDNRFGVPDNSHGRQTVVCESEPRSSQRCNINTRDGVQLTRQLSNTSCRGNWFSGNGFVEVKNGCGGVFESNNNNSSNNQSEYRRGYDDARRGNSYRNLNNTEDYDRGYRDGRR